jgi:hypothetical protein
MRNIQVIDGAENCVFDVFAATEAEFGLLFPPGEDVAFVDEVFIRNRESEEALQCALKSIWARRIPKPSVSGIHGLLFYGLPEKKIYYPTRRDEEASNPDGTRLRAL